MTRGARLELTWIGKDQRPRLEPRIVIEEPDKSYHAPHRVTENDLYDNKLIFGDNLLALKALEADYAGQVKCIYIDPPYNTGSAFTHYDDGLEHSIWLSMMRDRLEILRRLLREDGSIWINLDDNESHYCKVLCDEIFGRENFVANVVWQKKSSAQSNAVWLSDGHDHILVYGRAKQSWKPNRLERTDEQNAIYKYSDEHDGIDDSGRPYGRGPWFPGDFTISLSSGARGKQFAKTGQSNNLYEIVTPSGRTVMPAKGRCWAYTSDSFDRLLDDHRITFGKHGNNKPCIKRFLSEIQDAGTVPMTTWHYSEVGENRNAAQEVKALVPDDPFATPKPERLLQRIIHIATNPGDLVLDSFAGSGTTGAVAHKMGRRWIMIELGEHCRTHIIPRLQKVIDGTDQGGISKDVNWKGGGGFRYYRLAPSLLEKDHWGRWVISKEYDATQLAEAVCKHAGFRYAPDPDVSWIHGQSTETDFIYVTTQQLTRGQLEVLSDEVGPDRTLMVFCAAFEGRENDLPNLTVKKIPAALLKKCEWGKDDYSLKVANLPMAPQLENEQLSLFEEPAGYGNGRKGKNAQAAIEEEDPDLFEDDEIEESPPSKKPAAKKSSKGRGGKK
jgi:adenine-specific DNA-methyltransferase